jgi:hypothetical protein
MTALAEKQTSGFLGEFTPDVDEIVKITGTARVVLADYFQTFSDVYVNISTGE